MGKDCYITAYKSQVKFDIIACCQRINNKVVMLQYSELLKLLKIPELKSQCWNPYSSEIISVVVRLSLL